MKFYLRCDSSKEMGSGHVMRGLALATKLKREGHEVQFLCAERPGDVYQKITQAGFQLQRLAHVDEQEDARLCAAIIGQDPAVVVVDHYGLSEKWESAFYPRHKVMVIDDLKNRTHHCHVLLDFNYRRDLDSAYRDLVPANCVRLLGPSHFLIREEFLNCQAQTRKNQVLVFFGGTDPTDESSKFLRAAERVQVDHAFKILGAIRGELRPSNGKMRTAEQPYQIPELMAESSLYLGSGGTITYERLFMGLPGVVITVADNQEPATQSLAEDGYQLYLGRKEAVDYGSALEQCERLLHEQDTLRKFADRGRNLVRPLDVAALITQLRT